ncbi:MAG: ATP-binding cassette domain-containing protein, partial [Chitinivibrionales bacterium]|nr:ATP-binding cassette domain-containing protein [Chitinivibrionales bacterium]
MVQINDLRFAYRGKKWLFDGLQLNLDGGNIYGLLGKNGAGKTTLLKIICGLLFADRGSSVVLGCNSRHRSPELLQELVFIPEEFHVPSLTAGAYRKYYGPLYPRFSSEDFASYLKEFGIRETERLSSLSYGNKKKFLIAFGLATNCRLLILDEPTNGLDIPSKSQFRKLVAGALADDRVFIISTHQVR